MLGYGNPEKARQLYETLRTGIPEGNWRLPLVEIGEARLLSLSSRDFECHMRLQSVANSLFTIAFSPSEDIKSEIQAMYYYVLTSHQGKYDENLSHLSLLQLGKKLTSIKSFSLAFEYRILVHLLNFDHKVLNKLLSVLQELEVCGLQTLSYIGYRQAAIHARKQSDFKSAFQYYDKAHEIASRMNMEVGLKQLALSRGYSFFKQGLFTKAEFEYAKLSNSEGLDSIAPLLNENLALLAQAQDNIDAFLHYLKRAISFSTKLDSISHLPGELLYLGQFYENHQKDLEQAEYYYKQGYDHAMRYASHGISLTGDRKDVVDAYVRLINKRRSSNAPDQGVSSTHNFAFAEGKSWKDIKDIFHHQLICFHLKQAANSKSLAKKLNMPPSTLYSVQNRLKERGYLLPEKSSSHPSDDHPLSSYIEVHDELTWEDFNTIFEREIIHYLYEKYGYSKQRMAQILELSYPSIITKTRELTKVNDHLLPN